MSPLSVVFRLAVSTWAYPCGDVLAVLYVCLNLRREISARCKWDEEAM